MIEVGKTCQDGNHRWSNPQDHGGGRQYCLECGEPKTSTAVDWEKPFEAAHPIRMPTREELLEDSRRGKWQPWPTEQGKFDQAVIITRPIRLDHPELGWLLSRLQPGEAPFIHGLRATHWCEDTLGTPVGLSTPAA